MKRPIKIEDMFFSDGEIEEYKFNNDELIILFKDSSSSKLRLYFNGRIEVEEHGSIGLSVYESRLDKEGDRTSLRLLDDDLKDMLTIKFRSCQIEAI